MKTNRNHKKSQSIPKIIHYCWFGGKPLPDSAKKCIDSWKKYFPDYEIKQWNESNFDINLCNYTKEAYEREKYAFLSDVVRLFVIERFGGIYFDTDVEVISDYDDILKKGAFFGLESTGKLATGLGFGAEKNNWLVKAILDDYSNKHFVKNGREDATPCPITNSRVAIKNGFSLTGNEIETVNGVTVYPRTFFNPKSGYAKQIKYTKDTHSIHHFDGSWLSKQEVHRASLRTKLTNMFGKQFGNLLYKTLFSPYLLMSHILQEVKNK